MLGGDNMDAAVARKAEEQMTARRTQTHSTQWSELVQASRAAKESLLSANAPDSYHLSVVAEGGRLIGGSMSARSCVKTSNESFLTAFFPHCGPAELPRRATRVALQEFGLPYAQDPAITRQLAGFLQTHIGGRPAGRNSAERRRVQFCCDCIAPGRSDFQLVARSASPDSRARARIAGTCRRARRRMVRHGSSRNGTAHRRRRRPFFLCRPGNQTRRREPKALCLIPRGHEEGQTVELGGRTFNLMLGRPVQFPLFTSTSDRVVSSGEIVGGGGRPASATADPHGIEECRGKDGTGSRASARNSDGDRNARTVVRVRRVEGAAGGSSSNCAARQPPQETR